MELAQKKNKKTPAHPMPEQLRIRLGHVKHSNPIAIIASDVQMSYNLSYLILSFLFPQQLHCDQQAQQTCK